MDNVTDEIIKRKIAAALNEPSVPQELVERTVDRVNAVISGREAEKQLAALSPAAPAERRCPSAGACPESGEKSRSRRRTMPLSVPLSAPASAGMRCSAAEKPL